MDEFTPKIRNNWNKFIYFVKNNNLFPFGRLLSPGGEQFVRGGYNEDREIPASSCGNRIALRTGCWHRGCRGLLSGRWMLPATVSATTMSAAVLLLLVHGRRHYHDN
jgi:hypothetical protein